MMNLHRLSMYQEKQSMTGNYSPWYWCNSYYTWKYMRIYGSKNDLFHYKYGHDTYWINLSTILYFKSNRKKITILTLTTTDEFYGSISSIINQLRSQGFISPHKSYLVNYRFIKATPHKDRLTPLHVICCARRKCPWGTYFPSS